MGYVQQAVPVADSRSVRVVPARPGRAYLLIQNTGAHVVWFCLGDDGAQAAPGRGLRLDPCASLELRHPAPDGALWACAPAGASTLAILEGHGR